MNVSPRMIGQLHCVSLLDAFLPQARDKSYAEAVAGCAGSFLQDSVVSAFHFTCDDRHGTLGRDTAEHVCQERVKRDRVTLSGVRRFPLCVRDCDVELFAIHISHRDRSLANTAAGEKLDLTSNPHPSCAIRNRKGRSRRFYLFIGQLRFNLRWLATNAHLEQNVAFGILAPNCLINQEGQKPKLIERGVAQSTRLAPFKIFSRVLVSYLTRMAYRFRVKPFCNPLPCVSCSAPSRINRVMSGDVSGYPITKGSFDCSANARFVQRLFVRYALRCASLLNVIAEKASRFFSPYASIQVSEANEPKFGVRVLAKMRHLLRVCHALTKSKCKKVGPVEDLVGESGATCAILIYHYTTGYQFRLILSNLHIALTRLSQITFDIQLTERNT